MFVFLEDVVGTAVLTISDVFVEVFYLLDEEELVFLSHLIQFSEGMVKVKVMFSGFLVLPAGEGGFGLLVAIIEEVQDTHPTGDWSGNRAVFGSGFGFLDIRIVHPLVGAVSVWFWSTRLERRTLNLQRLQKLFVGFTSFQLR
jgi:hypothetical protein